MPDFVELLVVPNAEYQQLGHELGVDTGLSLFDVDECDLLHRLPGFLLSGLLEVVVDGCVSAPLADEAVLENAREVFELFDQFVDHNGLEELL